MPRTARGVRTRAALVDAARTVFERDGYLDTRLTDITAQARCATGSFYTYFANKQEIFAAVLEQVQEEMLHPHVREMTDSDDPVALIDAANRAYLETYERNAPLMRLLEQVANIDDEVRELRRRRGAAFAKRNAASIRDLTRPGRVGRQIERRPEHASPRLEGQSTRALGMPLPESDQQVRGASPSARMANRR